MLFHNLFYFHNVIDIECNRTSIEKNWNFWKLELY